MIYAGGGANELMTGTRQWNTGIVAHGRIYFGADNKVYAFHVPAGTPTPTPTATASPTPVSGGTNVALVVSGGSSQRLIDLQRQFSGNGG
ncbi:MAG TPA: hypothetical protein VGK91_05320 [Candidatus Udaeobacter sp.]